jgi:glycogen debranching enzyme
VGGALAARAARPPGADRAAPGRGAPARSPALLAAGVATSVALDESRFSLRDRFLFLRRYWQGPTWINAAWLLWLGLVRLGYRAQAAEMAARIGRAVAGAGLREYYDPFSGRGMGATDFSWSALALELVEPDPHAGSSHLAPPHAMR